MTSYVRTRTHYYPTAEVHAMKEAYNGKRCIYDLNTFSIEWSHQLDAAVESSTRLEWMLKRKLREDKHPKHAAEIRENVVPVCASHHGRSDRGIPSLTLFPHEDWLARTLEYELEVATLRQSQVQAGNGDPGRPPYHVAYGGFGVDCRAHIPSDLPIGGGIHRYEIPDAFPVHYSPIQCPGIGVGVDNPFPIIRTLLSMPFSLLHQVPRLASMSPLTAYQSDCLILAHNIIRLWSWDPIVPPQDATVPASAATSSSQYQTFQDLGSIASRTATLKSIWPRIGEAGTFHGRLGAPAPLLDGNADEDLDSDTENLYSSSSSRSSSSSSGGALSDWDRTPFVGGTANDMLMARGHLDPGVYVDFVHIPTGVETGREKWGR